MTVILKVSEQSRTRGDECIQPQQSSEAIQYRTYGSHLSGIAQFYEKENQFRLIMLQA